MRDRENEPLAWFHAELTYRGQWLHGDPRGFRDRDHRIHSSGDYKNPPPAGEHAGLHRYMKQRLRGGPVSANDEQRAAALELARRWCAIKHLDLAAMNFGREHGHVLCQLPAHKAKPTLGWMKRYISTELGKRFDDLTGSVFSGGGTPRRVRTADHLAYLAREYVTQKHAREGAVTWWCGEDGLQRLLERFEQWYD